MVKQRGHTMSLIEERGKRFVYSPEPVELEFWGMLQLVQLPPAEAPAGAEL